MMDFTGRVESRPSTRRRVAMGALGYVRNLKVTF